MIWSLKKKILAPICIIVLAFVFAGCTTETEPSLWPPAYEGKPAPTITSLVPPSSALAGVSTITINGSNFSPRKEENLVYFDATVAEILEASVNQLKVKAPNLVKDSIKVRVAVRGAELFSNTVLYRLEAAVTDFGGLLPVDEPWGIACDRDGNVYVSLMSGGVSAGVKKITPTGVRTDYSPPVPGVPRWATMKIGPGGYLYAARIVRALFRIPPGGGTATLWASSGLGVVYDFDFDAQGNIWAGGNNPAIYRIKPDRSVKAFSFVANVRSVRVYDNYVWLGARVDTVEGVWRFRIISADSLGPVEKYFDFTANYPVRGAGVFAITFSADGYMFVGTDGPAGIILVHPNRSWESFYPGLLRPKSVAFAWGKGTELYVTRERFAGSTPALIRINTLKAGAPYYGRQ